MITASVCYGLYRVLPRPVPVELPETCKSRITGQAACWFLKRLRQTRFPVLVVLRISEMTIAGNFVRQACRLSLILFDCRCQKATKSPPFHESNRRPRSPDNNLRRAPVCAGNGSFSEICALQKTPGSSIAMHLCEFSLSIANDIDRNHSTAGICARSCNIANSCEDSSLRSTR